MILIPPHSPEEAALEKAMNGKPLAVGPELDQLLVQWLVITSSRQPGQPNALRFPFLKWAVHGRAKSVLAHLRAARNDALTEVADEIERIADFPFPPQNDRARAQAMEIWAWLKKELRGKVE